MHGIIETRRETRESGVDSESYGVNGAGGGGGRGGFDRVPDEISLYILNLVADVRSLALCRCVNRRFAALVPQVETLVLKVDAVIPTSSDEERFQFLLLLPLLQRLFTSFLSSVSSFFSSSPSILKPTATPSPPPSTDSSSSSSTSSPSPSSLIRGFDRVRRLAIELPNGDLQFAEKGVVVRWRAEFGKTIRSFVILAARKINNGVTGNSEVGEDGGGEVEAVEEGLKERVIWTIGALIAASSRHHMVREVVRGEKGGEMEEVEVRDRQDVGRLVLLMNGIREWREEKEEEEEEEIVEEDEDDEEGEIRRNVRAEEGQGIGRTTLPAMRMRMRHHRRLNLGDGIGMEEAVLVVARAAGDWDGAAEKVEAEERMLVSRAFDGVFQCAAKELMKKPSYVLDINSF